MKNSIIYIALAAGLIGLTACEDEYENPTGEPNHFSVFLSEEDFNNQVQVNDHIDFGDVSRGVISRTWTFPSGVVDIVGSENNETSSEPVVKAVFIAPGTFEVKLNQQYAGDAYIDEDVRGTTIDTTYTIIVFDTVRSSFTADLLALDGSVAGPLTVANGALNKVEAGSAIRFSATSTGGPSTHTWVMAGGDPERITTEQGEEEVSTAEIKYKKLGVYDAMLISSRARPFGADTVVFEDFIEITPSLAPVLVDRAFMIGNSIGINFSREMQNPADEAPNFTVTIRNNGEVITPSVSAVRLDPDANNIIYLDLGDELLYNTDTITVGYEQGTLTSTDFYLVDPFSDVPVDPVKVNLLAGDNSNIDFGIESTFESNWPFLGWASPFDKYNLTISSDQAYTGTQSARITLDAGGGMIIGHRNDAGDDLQFTVEADKVYEIGAWVYVVSLGDKNSIPDLRFYWSPNTNWGVGGMFFDENFPVGRWVYRATQSSFASSGDYTFMIRGHNEFNTEQMEFYMDNITVVELQQRP